MRAQKGKVLYFTYWDLDEWRWFHVAAYRDETEKGQLWDYVQPAKDDYTLRETLRNNKFETFFEVPQWFKDEAIKAFREDSRIPTPEQFGYQPTG